MKRWLALVLVPVLMINCSNASSNNGSISQAYITQRHDSVIILKFTLQKDSRSAFEYIDRFGSLKQVLFDKVPKDTVLLKKFTSINPLELYYNFRGKILFVLTPGDTINIIVNKSKIHATSHLHNPTVINFFNGLDGAQQSIFDYEQQSYSIKLPDRIPRLDSLYINTIRLLERKQASLSPEMYSTYSSIINYEYLRFKLTRFAVDKDARLPGLKDSIHHLIKKEDKYYLNEFISMLDVYNKVKWGVDFNSHDYNKRMYDSSYHFYTGEIRNRMLLMQLTGIRNKNPKYLNEYLYRFYADCSDNELIQFVKTNFVNESISKVAELKNLNTDSKSWEQILESHKGKVTYIDFWASWCAPCRKEMPGAKQLINTFGSESFSYIFISIDDLFTNWKEACGEEDILGHASNYILANPGNADLTRILKLSSVPRYILVNKQGEIVDYNAPSPIEILKNKTIEKLISSQ